jgi:hypothetical protein
MAVAEAIVGPSCGVALGFLGFWDWAPFEEATRLLLLVFVLFVDATRAEPAFPFAAFTRLAEAGLLLSAPFVLGFRKKSSVASIQTKIIRRERKTVFFEKVKDAFKELVLLVPVSTTESGTRP